MLKTNFSMRPFLAADGAGGGGTNEGADNNNGNQSQSNDNNANNNNGSDNNAGNNGAEGKSGEKTFTQEDLNRVGKQEKESGKKAMLKSLGFEDEKSAKEAISKYNEYLESQKTEEQKQSEALTTAQNSAKESEQRALRAEAKVTALTLGANPDGLEDLITLALTKVTDDKDLESVMKEMQGSSTFSSFFNKTENDEEGKNKRKAGTGNNVGTGNTGTGGGSSLASRLAAKGTTGVKKSSYFTK